MLNTQHTVKFKESLGKRARAGEKLADIIRSFGLKPEVLGERRIKGIYAHLNEQVAAGLPFTDEIRNKTPANAIIHKPATEQEQTIKIRNLEHEVLYLKQELNFIKKIILADKEVKSKCSSKRSRVQSMK